MLAFCCSLVYKMPYKIKNKWDIATSHKSGMLQMQWLQKWRDEVWMATKEVA